MSKMLDLFKFHGKLDNVVGLKSRGNHYTRMAGCVRHDRNTVKQRAVRAMFKVITIFIAAIGGVYREGYRHYNTAVNQRGNFFRQIWDEAVTGSLQEGYSVDPTKVLIARGSLTPCHTIAAAVTPATQTVTVSWSDNSGVGDAEPTDELMYCFFNLTKMTNIYGNNVATRAEETYSFNYPADWAGDTCYLYVAWSSINAESVSKMLGVYSA